MSEFDYDISDTRSSWLEPILFQWIAVNQRYDFFHYSEDRDWRDRLLFHGERPAVGALSAACWLAGGYSLEEFRVKKRLTMETPETEADVYGRCDLYIGIGSDYGANIEAKHQYFLIGRGNKKISDIIESSYEADKIRKPIKEHGDTFYSALFLSFLFDRKRRSRVEGNQKDDFVAIMKLIEKTKCSAKAWYFPDSEETSDSEKFQNYGSAVFLMRRNREIQK